MWGAVKDKCYADKPETIDALKDNILEAIEPFFFENEQGEAITVNGDRYLAMLNDFLFTKIEEEDIGNIWFQLDGATCHNAALDICTLFLKIALSLPRSCELTPLDYYLWGVAKDKCYADKP